MAFDDQARADLDAIYRESERHGSKLQSAFPEYGTDGAIDGGAFGFPEVHTYVYEPWSPELPQSNSEVAAAVDQDWYTIDAAC